MKQSTKICLKSLWIIISWAGVSTIKSSFCCLKLSANGRNMVGSSCVHFQEAKRVSLRNNAQQRATTCNRVCKRTQNVTYYNVGCCWATILRPFTQGLMIHWFLLGLLEIGTVESESDGQTNWPRRYKCGKVSRLISDTCDTVDTCFD